jgi:hypothetical protein
MSEENTKKEVKISEMPSNIKIEGIEMTPKGCITISYQVAEKNSELEIIEGLVIVLDNQEGAKAMAHMWNRSKNIDFDVTYENVWKDSDEMKDTIEVKYYEIDVKNISSFNVVEIMDFSEETKKNVDYINNLILEKTKK